jgi:hypothetical protein
MAWSGSEAQLIVQDYFDMLLKERRGQRYIKAEHNRRRATRGVVFLTPASTWSVVMSARRVFIRQVSASGPPAAEARGLGSTDAQ